MERFVPTKWQYTRKPAINYRDRALAASINTYPALPAYTFTHRHLKIDHRRYAYTYVCTYIWSWLSGVDELEREYICIYIAIFAARTSLSDCFSLHFIFILSRNWRYVEPACIYIYIIFGDGASFSFFLSFLEWKILIGGIDKAKQMFRIYQLFNARFLLRRWRRFR